MTSILSHNVTPIYTTRLVNAFAVEVLDLHMTNAYKRRHVVVCRRFPLRAFDVHWPILHGNGGIKSMDATRTSDADPNYSSVEHS